MSHVCWNALIMVTKINIYTYTYIYILYIYIYITLPRLARLPSCVLIFVGAALISKQKLNDNYNDGNNSWNILFLSCLNSTKWSVLITSGGLRGSGKSSSVLLCNSPRWGIAVPHSWSSIILTKSKIIVVVVVVEWYCIITIYYCWAPQCTYLPSRLRLASLFFIFERLAE